MALRRRGEYWYGDGPKDVWKYFVRRDGDCDEPVRHWKQAVCKCGHTGFAVVLLFEDDPDDPDERAQPQLATRTCVQCGAAHDLLVSEDMEGLKEEMEYSQECVCFCDGEEYEVIGVTAPRKGSPESAQWFFLGLRCVGCGCLGCYASWLERYNDYRELLALL
jgi:hypothetical protein